jgi:hypothetical protein
MHIINVILVYIYIGRTLAMKNPTRHINNLPKIHYFKLPQLNSTRTWLLPLFKFLNLLQPTMCMHEHTGKSNDKEVHTRREWRIRTSDPAS